MENIKRDKKKRWNYIAASGLVSALVMASSIAVFEYNELQNCLQEKKGLEQQLESYCHMVYVAAEKIPKGTVLERNMLHQEIRYSDLPIEKFITDKSFGMTLTVDVAEGTCLMEDMLYLEQENVREIFLSEVELPEHLQTGDRIDVRIRYENAEDYIVLADKVLERYETVNGMVLRLSEEEILLLASAIADSGDYSGTRLYAVEYPEYEMLDSSQVNYIAAREILALLGREKTEGESRTALEKRLMQEQ